MPPDFKYHLHQEKSRIPVYYVLQEHKVYMSIHTRVTKTVITKHRQVVGISADLVIG